MGFKHRKVTPLWPRANCEYERFMRILGKVVQGARTENKPCKQEKFPRNYHVTPHSTLGRSPAFGLFGHEMKIKFSITLEEKIEDHTMRQIDVNQTTRMKEYADQRRQATLRDINPDDIVLVKQKRELVRIRSCRADN